MGKKRSGRNGGEKQEGGATAFVLRVAMHCRCNGCDDKIRAAVKDLTLHHGIEALDQSALVTKGELGVLSTADPEKLRRRLRKATGKTVDLILPKPPHQAAADKEKEAAAVMEALLRRSLQQQQPAHAHQYGGHGQVVLPGWGGYGPYGAAAQAAAAYPPWAAVQQPEAYPPYHHHSAYPAAAGAWGAYNAAYPPAAAQAQAYGGGWHTN